MQFDRVYRQSAATAKSRIAYLLPDSERQAGLARYMAEFAKLLELAERRNVRIVVIKMPTPAQFRALLPNEPVFDAAMTAALANRGIGFSDFSAEQDEPRFYFDRRTERNWRWFGDDLGALDALCPDNQIVARPQYFTGDFSRAARTTPD